MRWVDLPQYVSAWANISSVPHAHTAGSLTYVNTDKNRNNKVHKNSRVANFNRTIINKPITVFGYGGGDGAATAAAAALQLDSRLQLHVHIK